MSPPSDIDRRIKDQLEFFRSSMRTSAMPEQMSLSADQITNCSNQESAAAQEQSQEELEIAEAVLSPKDKGSQASSEVDKIAEDAADVASPASSAEGEDDQELQQEEITRLNESLISLKLQQRSATPAPSTTTPEFSNSSHGSRATTTELSEVQKHQITEFFDHAKLWVDFSGKLKLQDGIAAEQLLKKFIKNLRVTWFDLIDGTLPFSAVPKNTEIEFKLDGGLDLDSVGLELQKEEAKQMLRNSLLCLELEWETAEEGWMKFSAFKQSGVGED